MMLMMNAKLAATVAYQRMEKGWTQEHLAEVAGISARTVQRVERDGSASADTLQALASALDVDVKMLLEGVNTNGERLMLLARVTTGKGLMDLMGSHACRFDHDEPRSDDEREALGEFLDAVKDWNDIWKDVDPSGQLDAGKHMLSLVNALEKHGLWVFALKTVGTVRFGDTVIPDWVVANVVVQRDDHPGIVNLAAGAEG
jgi:transcriptional regulator with XRE-family HTH domain